MIQDRDVGSIPPNGNSSSNVLFLRGVLNHPTDLRIVAQEIFSERY